ncbi:MAG TPA: helix-turn-helix domain-containing protein [Microthrixaceae bacterium]|nr:helix-turn-helix domain-containing protein [Microthrixaceae bacterium]
MSAPAEPRANQREHILDTTLRLMSEHGAAGMSMRQLAAACGVQVAAIYHYFPSKDALLAAVVAERQYGARMSDPLPIDLAAPADARLRDLYRFVWDGAMEEEAIWKLLMGEGLRGELSVLPVGHALLDLLRTASAGWIRQWVPELAEPAAVGQLLVGQMVTGFLRMMFEPDLDRAVIADDGADALVTALRSQLES